MKSLYAICMLLVFGVGAEANSVLLSADFEGEFAEDGIAKGWSDNSSWADVDVTYGRETENPHSGDACQRITCSRLDYGAVQMVPEDAVPLTNGKVYRVRGWLRGDVGPVALQLRLAPSPYTIYVEQSLPVTGAWQQLEYVWTSTVDDPNGRFMLRFTHTGTLWVDDLSVEELTPQEARQTAPPPEAGNLLHNGSFDLGLANWLLGHGADYWREAQLSIRDGEGGPCLKMIVPDGIRATLSSDVVAVAAGHPLLLGCRVRADSETPITVSSQYCWRQVTATDAWQPVTASGEVGFAPAAHDYVRFSVTGPATMWIDDVVLRQDGVAGEDASRPGVAPPFRPRAAIMPAEEHIPLGLYVQPEEPKLRVLAAVTGTEPVSVNWLVRDFWGEAVLAGRYDAPPGHTEHPLVCSDLSRGWYRGEVRWMHNGREYRNERTFCVLPPAGRKGDIHTSPFGAHFSVDPTSMQLADAVGCRWLRLHPPNHTKWRVVEPNEGEWAWRDEPIRIARQRGFELIGSLDRCPDWASSAPEGTPIGGFYTGIGAWVPRNWDEWERYVAATVRRYKEDIHIWEVWNEPNLTSWLRPVGEHTRAEAYTKMLRHTHPIVKRVDPSATVIGGCVAGAMTETSGAWQFTCDIIDLGALDLMDVFSFHEYINKPVDEASDPIQDWIPRLRRKMRDAGRELPILNSEGGYSNPGTGITYRPTEGETIPPDDMARWLVRQYVTQIALGVRQFYFYNFFIDGSPVVRRWQGFLEGEGQPLPNVAAYATMTWLLDGAKFQRTEHPTGDLWLHHFDTPRGRLIVAWTRRATTAEVSLPDAARAWNLMGAEMRVPPGGQFTVSDAATYILQGT